MIISVTEFSKRLCIKKGQARASLQALVDGGHGFAEDIEGEGQYNIDDGVMCAIFGPNTDLPGPFPSDELCRDNVPDGAIDTMCFIGRMKFLDYRNMKALDAAAPWIARRTGLSLHKVRRHLETLEHRGYIGANITRRGWMSGAEAEELKGACEELHRLGAIGLRVPTSEWTEFSRDET